MGALFFWGLGWGGRCHVRPRAAPCCPVWPRAAPCCHVRPPQPPGLKPWVMIGRDRSALRAVLESGLKPAASGHPCPGLDVEDVYDQTDRGVASRGLQSPFLYVPFRAHRPVPIIAQDFSPGLSKKERRMTRQIEAEPRGDFSPLFYTCPLGHTDLSQS